MEEIEFRQLDNAGTGFGIEVIRRGFVVGHIGKRPDTGAFRYWRGWRGDKAPLGSPVYEDRDLEALKRKIRANP